jgi:molybdenum cofactor synthesis domain-containing protein
MTTVEFGPGPGAARGDDIVTAAVLVIGDEILSGRTKDVNIAAIAAHLTSIGIDLREARVVGDSEAAIIAALNELRARYTYVFTTGGIGPTHDDITADSIGKAFGVAVDIDPRAVAVMQPAYAARGLELTPARLRMARTPAGSELIINTVSAAPGFMIGNVIVMAGVPAIMLAMLEAATQHLRLGQVVNAVSIVLARPEADLAELFAAHQQAFPDVAMGSYPAFVDGGYRTELVLRGRSVERLDLAAGELRRKLCEAGLITPSLT